MMNQSYVICSDSQGKHKMAYTFWGNLDTPVLICVHGLTRVGRDFDYLAQALVTDGYSIICPDVVGRGESDWLINPADYNLITYAQDMLTLIRELNLYQVDWLGTSMGGLIAMNLIDIAASNRFDSPIRSLILNDVGAYIPQAAIQRIIGSLRKEMPIFTDLIAAETYIRSICEGFGNLTDEQWQHLTKYSLKKLANGNYTLHYDPKIVNVYGNLPIELFKGLEFWSLWQNISCPVLLLHGQESDLLLPETITEMQTLKPELTVKSFANIGHAPALMDEQQINIIKNWLKS